MTVLSYSILSDAHFDSWLRSPNRQVMFLIVARQTLKERKAANSS